MTKNYNVIMLKAPDQNTLNACKEAALATVGKRMVNQPNDSWLFRIADAEHSPIRRLEFSFTLEAPYWVLNELRTHHVGCEMYMQSSRNDRQSDFDRNEAPQGMLRICQWDCNLQGLMDVCHKRLCAKASKEVRELVGEICDVVIDSFPWTRNLLVPMCVYRGCVCHEMQPCGMYPAAYADKTKL